MLRPFFRRCWARDAWILRAVGNRHGPVLVERNERGPDAGGQRSEE